MLHVYISHLKWDIKVWSRNFEFVREINYEVLVWAESSRDGFKHNNKVMVVLVCKLRKCARWHVILNWDLSMTNQQVGEEEFNYVYTNSSLVL